MFVKAILALAFCTTVVVSQPPQQQQQQQGQGQGQQNATSQQLPEAGPLCTSLYQCASRGNCLFAAEFAQSPQAGFIVVVPLKEMQNMMQQNATSAGGANTTSSEQRPSRRQEQQQPQQQQQQSNATQQTGGAQMLTGFGSNCTYSCSGPVQQCGQMQPLQCKCKTVSPKSGSALFGQGQQQQQQQRRRQEQQHQGEQTVCECTSGGQRPFLSCGCFATEGRLTNIRQPRQQGNEGVYACHCAPSQPDLIQQCSRVSTQCLQSASQSCNWQCSGSQ